MTIRSPQWDFPYQQDLFVLNLDQAYPSIASFWMNLAQQAQPDNGESVDRKMSDYLAVEIIKHVEQYNIKVLERHFRLMQLYMYSVYLSLYDLPANNDDICPGMSSYPSAIVFSLTASASLRCRREWRSSLSRPANEF